MMKTKIISLIAAAAFLLAGCTAENNPFAGLGTKQGFGSAIGAVAGGVAGSKVGGGSGQLWATGAGALLGAFIGSEVGKSLDKADLAYHRQATEEAYTAPLGETISWNNPQSGHSGNVTATREGQTASGSYCRQYKQTIIIDGQAETAVGTACQQSDGTWKLTN